jgi:hypothetical protein
LNRRGRGLQQPVAWVVRFAPEREWTLRYDGDRWSVQRGRAALPDLTIEATPEAWVTFLLTPPEGRSALLGGLRIDGAEQQVEQLMHRFGWWEREQATAGS